MPNKMGSEIENEELINSLFLDMKTLHLTKEHKKEYASYLKKNKTKKIIFVGILTLVCFSGVYLYLLDKKDSSYPTIYESKTQKAMHVSKPEIVTKSDFLDSLDKIPEVHSINENKNSQLKIKEAESLSKIKSISKPPLSNSKAKKVKEILSGTEKLCPKKFEDFGIQVLEKKSANLLTYNIIDKENPEAKIKELKLNGKTFQLPIEDLSYGKYVFEITDENECKYMKILKINQLSWEETK